MTIGDKVGYEAYLGCSDVDIIYGTITKEYGDSFIITDRDGVEHTCYDKNNLFKVDTFPLRCKKIFDHYVYEDGTIFKPCGTKKYIKSSKSGRGLYCEFNKDGDIHTIARVVYKLFVDPEFDLNNKDYCITFIDGNILNTHWSNLEKVTRAELNRRIAASKKADNLVKEIKSGFGKSNDDNLKAFIKLHQIQELSLPSNYELKILEEVTSFMRDKVGVSISDILEDEEFYISLD